MYKKLIGETFIYGIGSILPRLLIFVLNALYISYLNNTEYAKFSQLYAATVFLNVILTFGFETAFFRFSPEKNNYQKTLNTSFWFMTFNALFFLILIFIFQSKIADIMNYNDHPEYLLWFGFIAFFDTICVIPFAVLRFKNKPIYYSSVRVIQNVFQVILTLLFFMYFSPSFMRKYFGLSDSLSYPFFANLLASILGIILLINVIKEIRFRFNVPLFKKMFRYAYPIMLSGLAFTLNENLDKLIQRNIIPESDAGSYSGCYKLAMIMTLFVTAYRMGIEPFLFKVYKNHDSKKTYADILLYFSLICNLIILGVLANLSWIASIFVPNKSYHIAMDIVPIILVANLFYALYYNLSTWYKVTDKTYVGTIISLLGGAITIVLNLLFLKKFGFMVSAWATLLAYATMMITSYIWGQKNYKIPYKTKLICIHTSLVILLGFIQYYWLDSSFIMGNLIFIAYIGFIFVTEKNKFKKLLKKT